MKKNTAHHRHFSPCYLRKSRLDLVSDSARHVLQGWIRAPLQSVVEAYVRPSARSQHQSVGGRNGAIPEDIDLLVIISRIDSVEHITGKKLGDYEKLFAVF